MSPHRVVTTGRADEDIERAVAYYLHAGSPRRADDFVDALEACVHRIAAHPSIGSPRFAIETGISEIRTIALQRFPYLVFYSEDADAVRVHRVLHTSRDLPAEYAR
ncbi:type II toxin-antitoxin system RelE/ParE family toxin [Homoserinibacter gongjuensis]|uniref:Plasmid stabilization protein n=1 Tax=Homoserinibacter gongjuensis TaxID=1162968 RepID=A0ABQ6JY43_9MICO|nr:type II toxin-antitoxin system RelE/ParE family toxin [Homoserinibacter gongjuensis]GMA91506.1 plasmid stabilization protein [Homoserinibacter gongjuensis]